VGLDAVLGAHRPLVPAHRGFADHFVVEDGAGVGVVGVAGPGQAGGGVDALLNQPPGAAQLLVVGLQGVGEPVVGGRAHDGRPRVAVAVDLGPFEPFVGEPAGAFDADLGRPDPFLQAAGGVAGGGGDQGGEEVGEVPVGVAGG